MISQCRKTGRNNNIILLNIEPSFTIHLCQWNVLCCRWENLAHIFSMTWRQEKAGAGTGDQRVVWRHLQQRRQPQHRLRGLLHCQAGQGRGQGGGGAAGRDALPTCGEPQFRARGCQLQDICRQSAKAKLKNRHFTGGFRGSKPFFLTLQT